MNAQRKVPTNTSNPSSIFIERNWTKSSFISKGRRGRNSLPLPDSKPEEDL
jgi:hypothetical protein